MNYKLINKNIRITGTKSNNFVINAIGKLLQFPEIEAKYIKDFPLTIIAEADIRRKYDLRFIYGDDMKDDKAYIFDKKTKQKIAKFARSMNNLYTLQEDDEEEDEAILATIEQELNLSGFNNEQIRRMKIAHEMHRRMGYLSTQNMENIIKFNGISGRFNLGHIDDKDVRNYKNHLHKYICNGCKFAKMDSEEARLIEYNSIPQQPGTLHADVMHVTYDEGTLEYLVGIDQQSAMTFAVQLSKNHGIAEAAEDIRNCYKRYGHELKDFHFDNEPAINNKNTKSKIHAGNSNTIFHTPGRHVRRAENVIKLIKRTFKAVIIGLDYACPYKLYPYVIRWAVQSINLTSKSGNALMAPWTIFTGNKLDFSQQFTNKFGDIVITRANSDDSQRPKTNKAVTTFAVVLCHDENIRGTYVLIDLNTKRIIKRRQMRIYQEDNAIIKKGIESIGRASANTSFGHVKENSNSENEEPDEEYQTAPHTNEGSRTNISEGEEPEHTENNNNGVAEDLINVERLNDDGLIEERSNDDGLNDESADNELLRDSDCESISEDEIDPIGDCEENVGENEPEPNADDQEVRRSSRSWQPTQRALESFALAAIEDDNLSINEANESFGVEITNKAVMKEINNMFDKKVWTETQYAPNMNIVPSQLFLKPKYKANGEFDKLKARLVACGNRQRLPNNFLYTDIESPTASIGNIFAILQMIPKLKYKLNIVDIAAAYLHAEIEGDIYMRLNENISNIIRNARKQPGHGDMIVKLQKCIYGLKQSGRRWFELLSKELQASGLKQSTIDRCVFHANDTIVAIYVDDIIIASKYPEKTIQHLETKFGEVTKQTGDKFSFLGMNITVSENAITITQDAYINKITKEIEMQGAHRCPHKYDFRPKSDNNAKEENKSPAMKAMYLATRTRPEILFNTSILATNTYDTSQDILKLFRYLKESKSDGLKFTDAPIDLHCYCDASFMMHHDRKSHTGFAIFLDKESGAVITKSKKQQSIAQSSTEAELIALFEAGRHLLLLQDFLNEIGIQTNTPVIYEDNKAVISIVANNAIPRGNSRFIERKYLASREWITGGRLRIEFRGSKEQIADGLTKAKYGDEFLKFKKKLLG